MSVEARPDKGFKLFFYPTSARFLHYNRQNPRICADLSAKFSLDRGLKPLPIAYSLLPLPTTRLILGLWTTKLYLRNFYANTV